MSTLQLQLLALVACISLVFWGGCRVERSRWEDQMAQSAAQVARKDSTIWRLRADSASLATKHSTDTLTLAKWMARWKKATRTVTLPGKTDTLPGKTDTLRLTTTQIIRIADNTISACSTALTSCQGLRLNAESRALALDGQNADLRKLLARPKPLVTPSRMVTLGLIIFAATKVF